MTRSPDQEESMGMTPKQAAASRLNAILDANNGQDSSEYREAFSEFERLAMEQPYTETRSDEVSEEEVEAAVNAYFHDRHHGRGSSRASIRLALEAARRVNRS